MIDLFVAEIRRAAGRRLVRVFAILALAGVALAAILVFFNHRALDARDAAQLERARETAITRCVESAGGLDPSQARMFCEQNVEVDRDERFRLTSVRAAIGIATVFHVLIALVLGASLFGAEFRANTVATLLTWESRRTRVFAARLATIAVGVFAFVVVAQVLLALALVPSALLRGTTAGATTEWWMATAGMGLRGALLAVMTALIAASGATLGRNTALPIGIVAGYLMLGEGLLTVVRPTLVRWLIQMNAVAFVSNSGDLPRSGGTAGLVLAGYTMVFVLSAWWIFRTRDVT